MVTEAQRSSARTIIFDSAQKAHAALATQQAGLLQEVRGVKDRARMGQNRPLNDDENATIDRLLGAAAACGSAMEDVALVTIEALENDSEIRFLTQAFADLNGALEARLKQVENVAVVAANVTKVVAAIAKIVEKLAVLAA